MNSFTHHNEPFITYPTANCKTPWPANPCQHQTRPHLFRRTVQRQACPQHTPHPCLDYITARPRASVKVSNVAPAFYTTCSTTSVPPSMTSTERWRRGGRRRRGGGTSCADGSLSTWALKRLRETDGTHIVSNTHFMYTCGSMMTARAAVLVNTVALAASTSSMSLALNAAHHMALTS